MAVTPGYREYVLEQLGRVTPVTAKSMFGGVGIYSAGRIFGLIDDDVLYFKVSEANRPDYERAGMRPFQPWPGQVMAGYWELPGEVLEEVDRLRKWMDGALAAGTAKAKAEAKARKGR